MIYKRKIILFGAIIFSLILVSTQVSSNVLIKNEIKNQDSTNETIKFQVLNINNGECVKTEIVLSKDKALELKEKYESIFNEHEKIEDQMEMQLNLLQEYNLVNKELTIDQIIEKNKEKTYNIIKKNGLTRFIQLFQKLSNPDSILNMIGLINMLGFGVTFALGTHTLLPIIGIDIGVLSIGAYNVITSGLFGFQEIVGDVFASMGIVLGFSGILVFGLFGIHTPLIALFGAYGACVWV